MNAITYNQIEPLIKLAISEDVGDGDITTNSTVPQDKVGKALMIFKEKNGGIIAGLHIVKWVLEYVDSIVNQKLSIQIIPKVEDGTRVEAGTIIAEVSGSLRTILTGERTALNFIQRLSGIATLTAKYVSAISGTSAKILDTRKTTPGWRLLEKYAVRVGGGVNHRMGLFDMVMIKDNHIKSAGGIEQAISSVRNSIKKKVLIEVETSNIDDVKKALDCNVDWIMLDNMGIDTMKKAVALINQYKTESQKTKLPNGDMILLPVIEASGGITLENIRAVAETGVDYISVGAITHSAKSADISLKVYD